jgi:hypothetical protein
MKNLIVPCLAVFSAAICYAAPADDVRAAVKKLADAPNYSWSTTVQNAGGAGGGGRGGGFGGGPQSGVAEKDGFAVITRETQNGPSQTVRKGEKVVLQNQENQWVTPEEFMAAFGGGGGRGGGAGGALFGGTLPADDLNALAAAATDLTAADGVISGKLNAEATAQRLAFGRGGRGGGGGQPPANAAGTVKFWVKDGAISKYEVNVKGTVTGRGGEVQVDRTTTTEIKNVGSSKAAVPPDALKKIGA